jgi:hypothetical protein
MIFIRSSISNNGNFAWFVILEKKRNDDGQGERWVWSRKRRYGTRHP